MKFTKSNFLYVLFFSLLAIIGCSSSTSETQTFTNRYFSLSNYFAAEADRLATSRATVQKTVKSNGTSSVQTRKISDWKDELALFRNADINKPSWRDAYRIDSSKNTITYTANSPDLTIREIIIIGSKNAVDAIEISKKSSNYLYSFSENLQYYPDSAYYIKRTQDIWLLGNDSSSVEVVF